MGCCKKCGTGMALVLVILGVLFALQDIGYWHFWNLNWYTVAFVLAGLSMWGCSTCEDCKACCGPKKSGKKSKKKKKK